MDQHHHSQLFKVGNAQVSRFEDMRLITGNGKYSSDWNAPDQLHACFLRSDRAHARIVSINYDKVSQVKGVVGVYIGADAQAAGYLRSASFLPPTGKGGMKARVPARPWGPSAGSQRPAPPSGTRWPLPAQGPTSAVRWSPRPWHTPRRPRRRSPTGASPPLPAPATAARRAAR